MMNPMMSGAPPMGGMAPPMPQGQELMAMLAMLANPAQLAAAGGQPPPLTPADQALLMAAGGGAGQPMPPDSTVPMDMSMITQLLASLGAGGMGAAPGAGMPPAPMY